MSGPPAASPSQASPFPGKHNGFVPLAHLVQTEQLYCGGFGGPMHSDDHFRSSDKLARTRRSLAEAALKVGDEGAYEDAFRELWRVSKGLDRDGKPDDGICARTSAQAAATLIREAREISKDEAKKEAMGQHLHLHGMPTSVLDDPELLEASLRRMLEADNDDQTDQH